MTKLQRLLAVAAAALVVIALAFAAGWAIGDSRAEKRHAAAESERAGTVLHELNASAQAGAKDAASLNVELADLRAHADQLDLRSRDVPLTVPRAACPPPRRVPAAGGSVAPAPAAASDPVADAGRGPAVAVVPGHREAEQDGAAGDADELTLGAVSVWNSALAGADVPAGPCGSPGAPDDACAAGAGIGIEQAWANHQLNATACAIDRTRYQRLIDHINSRQTGNLK